MKKLSYRHTKAACGFAYFSMSSVFSLPPLLFAAFREQYGISYTLLGTLVLVNFCTQLGIDLIFSFFSQHFNVHKTIRIMPLITAAGLCIYALIPMLFPRFAYAGLLVGTFIFSVAAGLAEVLVSPAVASLPSDNPGRDMSMLHSLYAYGFVTVVIVSSLFLQIFGNEYWMYLTFFWALPPVAGSLFLMAVPFPAMDLGHGSAKTTQPESRRKTLLLCVLCIFLGACAENTMSNWASAFVEKALKLPKLWGDIFGMAMFAILLGLTRTAYAKYGKNIFKVLTLGMSGAVVCYLTAAFSPNAVLSLAACAALGVCTAMLWPGTLILMEEKIPAAGVAAYALMAAGGDFGACVAPQGLGIIVDKIALSEWAASFGGTLSPEQLGFKAGMLAAALFPLAGLVLLAYMKKYFSAKKS